MFTALIGCERSGIIRDALRARGVDAWSCDLEKCEGSQKYHYRADVREIANPGKFNLFIVHPDCQYLSVSGYHWNYRRPARAALTQKALEFAGEMFILCDKFEFAILENPVSILSTHFYKPDQTIQPYDFGENASKRTCFWLWNLPLLQKTKHIPGRVVTYNGKHVERWGNQTDSGQNKLGPSEQRSMDRARTYPGVADALADQYVTYIKTVRGVRITPQF